MSEGPGAKDAPPAFTDEERAPGQDWLSDLEEQDRRELLDWVGEHLPRVRRSVYGQHFLYWSLGIAGVVGLAAHVGGYLLRSEVTTMRSPGTAPPFGANFTGRSELMPRTGMTEALRAGCGGAFSFSLTARLFLAP